MKTGIIALGAAFCSCLCLVEAAPASDGRFTNGIGMEFALIPAGSFMMGCENPADRDCDAQELPRRRVTISKPFYMATTEVTQAQWERVMGANPSTFKGKHQPVDYVSWFEAQEFIARLNKKEGRGRYRLPTEAEWEYAARAGSETRFYFGNDPGQLARHAWFAGNADKQSHPVAKGAPNAWGLYDVYGNVWEWVADWFDGAYYDWGPDIDPPGPDWGEARVLRGGSWKSDDWLCRSSRRSLVRPDHRYSFVGFRVAFSPEP